MEKYRYRIFNTKTGLWSRGGTYPPKWTTDINKAKLWDSKGSIKCHITQFKKNSESNIRHNKHYGIAYDPETTSTEGWLVQECKIVVHNTFHEDKFV